MLCSRRYLTLKFLIQILFSIHQSFPDNGTNSSQTMWKNELHDNDKIIFEWYFKTIHLFYVKFSHVKYYLSQIYDNFNLHGVETPLQRLCITTIGLVWNLQIIFHPFIIHIIRNKSLNNRKMSRCFATNQNNKIVDVERHLQIPYILS
jgi:hypothetical protein